MAELADALDLGSSAARLAGSTPVTRTKLIIKSNQKMITFSFIIGNNLITINYSTYTIITAKIINRGKQNE
jgi:hypothetical protein